MISNLNFVALVGIQEMQELQVPQMEVCNTN
jgi:hypothetical protein